MTGISNPDICSCGSQLFRPIWAVGVKEEVDEKLDPKKGNTYKRQVGFACEECGERQLTRKVPQAHADDESLDLPQGADRDMVNE